MAQPITLLQDQGIPNSEKKHEFTNSQGTGDAYINIDSRTTTAVNSLPDLTEKQKAADAEINHNITRTLQEYPRGYPLQAAFQSSDSSFSIYRSFDYLHSRVILELQDELRCLEEDLHDLDLLDAKNGRNKCLSSRLSDLKQARRDGKPSKRAQLLNEIRAKLVHYDEILTSAHELNAFQRPSARDYRSVRRWFFNEKPLSYVREEEFIKRKEDLVTLRHGREWAGFDGLVEDFIRKLPYSWTQKIFATPELREKTNNEHIFYYSSSRIEKLVGLLITIIVFVLLILPVSAMYKLTSIGNRKNVFDAIGILVVFTLLFGAAMSLVTKAKRHELFAASAAYCAVLVVFIGNLGSNVKT